MNGSATEGGVDTLTRETGTNEVGPFLPELGDAADRALGEVRAGMDTLPGSVAAEMDDRRMGTHEAVFIACLNSELAKLGFTALGGTGGAYVYAKPAINDTASAILTVRIFDLGEGGSVELKDTNGNMSLDAITAKDFCADTILGIVSSKLGLAN